MRRLLLCEEIERSSCGSVLFHGYLPPPGTVFPQLLLPGILSSGTGESQDIVLYSSVCLQGKYKCSSDALSSVSFVFVLLVFLTFLKCVSNVEFDVLFHELVG